MKLLFTLTCVLLVASSTFADFQSECSCGERPVSNFGEGNQAALNEFPWRVSIFAGDWDNRLGTVCDGTIISPSWILISAHCVKDMKHGDKVSVYFNSTVPMGKSWINADRHVKHPAYNPKTGENDLALVHLSKRLRFGPGVAPICLPYNYTEGFLQNKMTVETKWQSDYLEKEMETSLTNQECQKYYGSQVKRNMICTHSSGQDSCQTGSSSTMEYASTETGRSFIVGQLRSCDGCAVSSPCPQVYIEVGKYIDWIESTTKITYCEKQITEPAPTSCFVVDMGSDKKVQSIISRIMSLTPNDEPSIEAGLAQEIESDSDFSATWAQAEGIYAQMKEEGQFAGQEDLEMYHIALLTYTLDGFFWKFNKATYTMTTVDQANTYPYPYYMKVLDGAIAKVTGAPAIFTPTTTLYRGMSGRVVAREGEIMSFQQIVSSSRSKAVADNYASQTTGCQTLFVITGPIVERLGLDKHSAGTAKGNLEVLLPPEQSYVVTKVEENGLQRVIHLYAVNLSNARV